MKQTDDADLETYAQSVADASYDWYKSRSIRAKNLYRGVEIATLATSSSIPLVAHFVENALPASILGIAVVVLVGLRNIFHWQDNYLRYSQAREAVEAERRLYRTESKPYEDPITRSGILVSRVTAIEQAEMASWLKAVSPPDMNATISVPPRSGTEA